MTPLRDLRSTALYRQVEQFYATLHAPGTGQVTDAADLAVSPDGRRASFTGTVFDSLAAAPSTRVTTVDLDSGALRVEPSAGAGSRLPKWSPDGRTLAFLCDHQTPGDFQLCLIVDGQPLRAAPTVEGVIESLAWSPDGRRLLLGVAGLGADLAGCQGGATTRRVQQDLPAWIPAVDVGDADNLWRHAWIFDLESNRLTRVGPERLNVWETCWLGAGRIAAVVSSSHSEAAWYTARLVAIDLASGSVQDLYTTQDQVGVPAANPSGALVAIVDAVCSDRMIVCGDLRLIDPHSGTTRAIDTRGTGVTHVAWRDDGTIVYAGARGLESVIGEIDAASGVATEYWAAWQLTGAGWYPMIAALPGGGALMIAESWSVAPEIARIDAGGYTVIRSLASENSRMADPASASAEPFLWTGRDGLEIQGILIRPAGVGPWPLVMDIHGGPVWACRNRWQGRLRGARVLADHGIALLYPNPRGSGGRGQDFARLVKGDMGGEDTHDYLRGLDALVAAGIADPRRLGVTGISYGGFMSAWLVTQDQRFAAAAPISPVTNWFSQHRTSQIPHFDSLFLDGRPSAPDGLFHRRSPVMFADRVRTPVLQLTGALDQNTPPTQALEFHRALLELGLHSELVTYPTAGHGIRSFPEVIDATTRYVGWFLTHFAR